MIQLFDFKQKRNFLSALVFYLFYFIGGTIPTGVITYLALQIWPEDMVVSYVPSIMAAILSLVLFHLVVRGKAWPKNLIVIGGGIFLLWVAYYHGFVWSLLAISLLTMRDGN